MTFWESLDSSLGKNYSKFGGRARRKEFYSFLIAVLVVGILINIVFGFFTPQSYTDEMNNITEVLLSTMSDPNITEADSKQAVLKFYAEFDEAMANSPIIVKIGEILPLLLMLIPGCTVAVRRIEFSTKNNRNAIQSQQGSGGSNFSSDNALLLNPSGGNVGINTNKPAETLSIAGNVRVENSTDATQYLTITPLGINFLNTGAGSSTTSSSHRLDDYEEGTWTPGVEGLTTPGTYTITSAVGTYTKIGNQVTIVGRMDTITETVAGSSSVQITGLPFATANASNFSVGTTELSFWNIDNATNSVNCFALNNAVKLYVRETRDGLGIANVNIADLISGSGVIRLTMTYLTD